MNYYDTTIGNRTRNQNYIYCNLHYNCLLLDKSSHCIKMVVWVFREWFFKIIEKIQTLDDIDDNKKFQYEINNALTLYKLLGCEKPDYVWTPDSISHLAAEAFEIKLLCICDKDIDKDNERGRQIKIILYNFNSLQDIIDKCD